MMKWKHSVFPNVGVHIYVYCLTLPLRSKKEFSEMTVNMHTYYFVLHSKECFSEFYSQNRINTRIGSKSNENFKLYREEISMQPLFHRLKHLSSNDF